MNGDVLGWMILGFAGQLVFTARFLVQWIVSEVRRESCIPLSFWLLSLGGSAILLAYAIHREDPVFIVGQCTGFLIYSRNLVLIRRTPRSVSDG